jgi:hypothetical protein
MSRVFLHVGAGKTGTSAMQAALARHRAILAAAGLIYPEAPGIAEARAQAGEVNSGNGGPLARFLSKSKQRADWTPAETEAFLDAAFTLAAGRDLLFSSEGMQAARQRPLADLIRLIEARGGTVHIIFYLRHVLDVVVSAFAQFAKSGVLLRLDEDRRTLDRFVATAEVNWASQLEVFANAVGRERLHVRLYDAERRALLPGLLSLINPDLARRLPKADAVGVVNRTPNLAEQTFMLELNALPRAPALCRLVMNALLNGPPVVEAPPLHVSPEAFATFSAAHAAMVAAVNEKFLPAGTPLLLTSGRYPVGQAPAIRGEDVALIAARALGSLRVALPKR